MGRLRYRPFAYRADYDVHLLAPRAWREFGRALVADPDTGDSGVALHLEPVALTALPAIKWYGHFYPRLGRVIGHTKPDVIHLWEEPWSVAALQATILKGRAALVLEVDQNILKRLPPPFESIRRFVLKRTSLVLSRSVEATAVVRACGFKGPVRAIGYGVDGDVFHPDPASMPRERNRPLKLAYAGRLVEEKGLDDVLDALSLVGADVTLAIMGEGPHEAHLRERVRHLGLEGRVSISRWGAPQDVASFIRQADATVLLTRTTQSVREQFGRAIVESQSCGVPVIGSTCGAIPDVIADGGWIVPESDPATLARLIDHLSRNPEEMLGRAQAGLANVASRFTFDAVATALAEAWSEAAALSRRCSTVPLKSSPSAHVPRSTLS